MEYYLLTVTVAWVVTYISVRPSLLTEIPTKIPAAYANTRTVIIKLSPSSFNSSFQLKNFPSPTCLLPQHPPTHSEKKKVHTSTVQWVLLSVSVDTTKNIQCSQLLWTINQAMKQCRNYFWSCRPWYVSDVNKIHIWYITNQQTTSIQEEFNSNSCYLTKTWNLDFYQWDLARHHSSYFTHHIHIARI